MKKQIIIDYEEYLELEKIKKYYDSILDYVVDKRLKVVEEKRKERMGTWHYVKYDYTDEILSDIICYIRGKYDNESN